MKHFTRALCAGLVFVLLAFSACTKTPQIEQNTIDEEKIEISLWSYPIGGWNKSGNISSLLSSFRRAYPNIQVNVQTISYEEGDAKIEEAIEKNSLPDIVLEGPERLVAGWGARGLMVDLKDLWDDPVSDKIYDNVELSCKDRKGNYYIYPMCMTTHCMAINRDLFEKANALQYLDETTRTWTRENFIKAVNALYDYGIEHVGAVYCGGQGGDQGTRALVNNLYGGRFTDPAHTRYTVESEENIKALELLKDLKGIDFDPELNGTSEIAKFVSGELAMAFCWNVSIEVTQITQNPGLFDVLPMAFPSDGTPSLQGGIWGFGVFDNKDEKRIEASKTFIRYMTQEEASYERAVFISAYWPVRDLPDLYINDTLMSEYGIFAQYFGDFYQVTPGWPKARTAWWEMLQEIGRGEEIESAVHRFSEKVESS